MSKTVAYYRSSTDLQENSITMQQDFAHRFAVEKVLTIDEELIDAGVSARKNAVVDRPNMYRMVQKIKQKKIGTVVVYKRDRLARNAVEYMEFYRLCRDKQVRILFTAKNEFPVLYTPLGEFIELIMAGMVEHEAEQIADRIRAAQIANFRNEIKVGHLPYGLKEIRNGKKAGIAFISNQAKAELRTIFEDFVRLKFNLKQFALCLDDLGFTRMPRKKKRKPADDAPDWKESDSEEEDANPRPWNEQDIVNVITNPIFKGLHRRQFGDQIYEVKRPECRIVSDALWEQANQLLKTLLPEQMEHPHFDFLLDGFLICPEKGCNKMLTPNFRIQQHESFPTYECAKKNHPTSKKKFMLSANVVHQVVVEGIKKEIHQFVETHTAQLYNENANARKRELRKTIHQHEERIQRLETEFAQAVTGSLGGDFTDPVLVAKLSERYQHLQRERDTVRELQVQIEDRSLFSHIYERRTLQTNHIATMLKDMQPHEIRDLCTKLIYKVEVDLDGSIHLTLKYPLKPGKETAQ